MLSNQNNSHFLSGNMYRAEAGAGVKKKVEPEPEPKLNNLGSATLGLGSILMHRKS